MVYIFVLRGTWLSRKASFSSVGELSVSVVLTDVASASLPFAKR